MAYRLGACNESHVRYTKHLQAKNETILDTIDQVARGHGKPKHCCGDVQKVGKRKERKRRVAEDGEKSERRRGWQDRKDYRGLRVKFRRVNNRKAGHCRTESIFNDMSKTISKL